MGCNYDMDSLTFINKEFALTNCLNKLHGHVHIDMDI